jgi:hypothetical protein
MRGEQSRIRLSPQPELVEIFHGDLSIAESVEEMVSKRQREIRPLDLRHYASPKVMWASSSFRRFCSFAVRRTSQPVGEIEEPSSLVL